MQAGLPALSFPFLYAPPLRARRPRECGPGICRGYFPGLTALRRWVRKTLVHVTCVTRCLPRNLCGFAFDQGTLDLSHFDAPGQAENLHYFQQEPGRIELI